MTRRPPFPGAPALAALLVGAALLAACRGDGDRPRPAETGAPSPTPAELARHCETAIGPPRVLRVTERVYVAVGYDLANTILVHTPDGNVVVDAMMSPERAAEARAALLAVAPGPTRALVYTHSHVDHVGGAATWIEPGTEVWATEALTEHLVKQYGLFRAAEERRGARQFGRDVAPADLPCSALGRRPDFAAAIGTGLRAPTRTFREHASFEVGGVRFELVEAHGETDDQLFVWIPSERVLAPGDNFYRAFPNLYTIRGTRPRPVTRWIASLDAMRRRRPAHLVPSHTEPVAGEAAIAEALTAYRDAIQWVRDAVVRAANDGAGVDAIVAATALPAHLAARPELRELYGQVDWSARAIYGNDLGWFDERLDALYPLPAADAARREVTLMGGAAAVRRAAADAVAAGDGRWALHLLEKLARSGIVAEGERSALDAARREALRLVAAGVANSNGRAYLLESAWELANGPPPAIVRTLPDELLATIPLEVFFEQMPPRLRVDAALDVHEHLAVRFPEAGRAFHVTVRRGVAEVVEGEPLPGTPPPVGEIETDPATWKGLALDQQSIAAALVTGRVRLAGNPLAISRFLDRFERGA